MPETQDEAFDQNAAAPLPMAYRLLTACSAVGAVIFTAVYLIEGVTRPDYNPWQQAISALSLGPGGWVQQANFIVYGVLTLCSVAGWREALKPGVGETWYPILKVMSGLSLIIVGLFVTNSGPGYPPGAVVAVRTLHGTIHNIFSYVSITAAWISCFVLARRFAVERRWPGWTVYSVITGLLTIVFIAAFGAEGAHGGLAGLFERLATAAPALWGLLIVVRLWTGTGRLSTS